MRTIVLSEEDEESKRNDFGDGLIDTIQPLDIKVTAISDKGYLK